MYVALTNAGASITLPPIVRLHDQAPATSTHIAPALSFPQHATVQQVTEALREMQSSVECVYYLFVTDASEHLVGVVSLRDLLLAHHTARLFELMDRRTITLASDATLEEQARVISETGLLALPVVDDRGRLVGAMDVTDIIAALEQRSTANACHPVGVSPHEGLDAPLLAGAATRLLWQGTGLLVALLLAWVVLHTSTATATGLALLAFIPLLRHSGLVGRQAAALTTRWLDLGLIHPQQPMRVGQAWLREVLLAGVAGMPAAGLAGVLVGSVLGSSAGILIGVALLTSMLLAATLAVLLPVLCRRLQIDAQRLPAEALQLLSDICGILLFIGISYVLMG